MTVPPFLKAVIARALAARCPTCKGGASSRGGSEDRSEWSRKTRPFLREGPTVRFRYPPPALPYLPKPRRRYAKSAKHAVSAGLPEKMVLAWPP
jgi:hypothetical protein